MSLQDTSSASSSGGGGGARVVQEEVTFQREKHVKFLLRSLNVMPKEYSGQDTSRITLLYFVVAGLDVLGELHRIPDKQKIIDFVNSCQILPDKDEPEKYSHNFGFRGSPFFGTKFNPKCVPTNLLMHDQPHIAMTYTALLVLRILGDDFSFVNKQAILKGLRSLQQQDGSFSCVPGGSESDMRFIYCACAISHMLDDWSSVNKFKVYQYIIACQSYDGGIAQGPLQESHGGSTYCAVASLHLLGMLDTFPRKQALIQWCLERQVTGSGFQGRINKVPDTCYSFWIGGALTLLGAHSFTHFPSLRGHSFACQHDVYGGLSKWEDTYPDVLHTYLGMCGLAMGGEEGLAKLDCAIGCTARASGDWLLLGK